MKGSDFVKANILIDLWTMPIFPFYLKCFGPEIENQANVQVVTP